MEKFLKKLDKLEKFAFDHEREINEKFLDGQCEEMEAVNFSCQFVSIIYTLSCGQTVSMPITMKYFLKFKRDIDKITIIPKFLDQYKTDKNGMKVDIEYYVGQKEITFKKLKKLIQNGKLITIEQNNEEFIECCLKSLKNDIWNTLIPFVVKSTHEKYTVGTLFDYGYMMCALCDGYTIIYNGK